ncbi:MAG TPA: hypothetical protein VIL84_05635 [Devosiaceae bacterium]
MSNAGRSNHADRDGRHRVSANSGDDANPTSARVATILDPLSPGTRAQVHAAPVLVNRILTGPGSSKQTRHVELSLEGTGISYQPGDALGVIVRNDASVVSALLKALGLKEDEHVEVGGEKLTLAEALTARFECTTANARFLEHWARLSGAVALASLEGSAAAGERAGFLATHHVIDIVRSFPVSGITPADLIGGLKPLQPRYFSIASSQAAAGGNAHLLVATVEYTMHGEARRGVASGHFIDRAPVGGTLPVFLHANPHFRLPAGDAPIIMIGAGTGVAPYRAFLQQRALSGAASAAWLFYGDRNAQTDFAYREDWQGFIDHGALSRMDVAFSRDGVAKTYITEKLVEHATELRRWIDDGAHVYVCGDAARFAPSVHYALVRVLAGADGRDIDAAEQRLQLLKRQNRYQLDVY